MSLTDKQKLSNAFQTLREQGFVAEENYACCQNCGWYELGEEYAITDDTNVVFYHNQDNESFDEEGNLMSPMYLCWQGDANKIINALKEQGFIVSWPGTENKRIMAMSEEIYNIFKDKKELSLV